MFGHDSDPEGEMSFSQPDQQNTFSEIAAIFGDLHTGAAVIGIASILILVFWDKMLGGLLITSVIVRGSVNIGAGAQTKLAAIFHGVLLLVSVTFLAECLNMIRFLVWRPSCWSRVTNSPVRS